GHCVVDVREPEVPALNLLPERRAVGEVLLHQVLVDNADRGRVDGVAVVERASRDQRNVHRLEVVAADDFLAPVRGRFTLGDGTTGDDVRPGADVPVE